MQMMHDLLELSNFSINPTSIEVTGEGERNKYRIGISQIFANLTDFDDFEHATSQTGDYLKAAVDHLQPPAVDAISIVSLDVAATESFEVLRDRMNERLVSDSSGLFGAVGYDIQDSAWTQEFAQGDTTGQIQFGPMRNEELPSRLQVPEIEGAPPNMLGVMTDFTVQTGGVDPTKALAKWNDVLGKQRDLVANVFGWLRGQLI